MSDKTYCYPPDFKVLRNRFNIRDEQELDAVEREFVTQRMYEQAPAGSFDLLHLRAIHRHLFQDVYEWAGEIRTVEISKGGNQFQFMRFIREGMEDVHRRLVERDFLARLDSMGVCERGWPYSRRCELCPSISRGQWQDATCLP